MISYKDKTFCGFKDCQFFGDLCHRSLTEDVEKAAAIWWGSADAPISMYAQKPSCFDVGIYTEEDWLEADAEARDLS